MRAFLEAVLVVLGAALVVSGALTLRFVGYEYGHGGGVVIHQLLAGPPDILQTSL